MKRSRAKIILTLVAFVAVFLALLLVATFCDLSISRIMTKKVLPEGAYYATDFFGVLIEMVGCLPLYMFIAFACCVVFWYAVKVLAPKNKALGVILAVVAGIAVVAAFWYTMYDTMKYIIRHAIANTDAAFIGSLTAYRKSPAIIGLELVFGAILATLAIFATKLIKAETLPKLLKWAIFAGVAIVIAELLIAIIKDPIGRTRYRTINSEVGSKLIDDGIVPSYTPWYVINGQPDKGVQDMFVNAYGASDAFKSFPSGHTCSAGAIYSLILLPSFVDFKHKKAAGVGFWVSSIAVTGLVAIGRIMVGAHYMSDVLFGGTFAFLTMMIAREVQLGGATFKTLFAPLGKAKTGAQQGEEAPADDAYAEQDAIEPENVEDGDEAVEQEPVQQAAEIQPDEEPVQPSEEAEE